MADLKNNGISLIRPARCPRQATIIVVGVARSGTSMVASILDKLGLPMGDRFDHVVFEDQEMGEAIGAKDLETVRRLLDKRNQAHDKWGFKRPEAQTYLGEILPLFRNPRIIMPLRDPAAIARRNEISMQAEFLTMVSDAARKTVGLVDFACNNSAPTMMVSYEKGVSNARAVVDAIVDFCGLSPSEDRIEAAVRSVSAEPQAYLDAARIWHEGSFEGVRDGVARGWARRMPMKSHCRVEILQDGEVLAAGTSDMPRDDLETAGSFGFEIPVERKGRGGVLKARIAGTTFILPIAV